MPATLQQIADRLGVNRSTVSRVLHNPNPGSSKYSFSVREELAKKIHLTARQMGYRRNLAARSMVTGRFQNVYLLLSTEEGYSTLSPLMLRGIHDILMKNDYSLSLSMLPDSALIETWGVPNALSQASADGLLVNYTHHIPTPLVEVIRSNLLPCVWLNSKMDSDCVHPDDVNGAAMLTRHFVESGHRRIGYLDISHRGDPATWHYSAHDRCQGYLQTMHEAGLKPQVARLADNEALKLDMDPRIYTIQKLLAEAEAPPTAIIAYSDSNLPPTAQVARQLGLDIPRDIALATFMARQPDLSDLGLVTIARIPEQKVGAEATAMLLAKISAKNRNRPHRPKAIPFTLVQGITADQAQP